jgi:shikimate kinase
MKVVLIGYRGTGKSIVGKIVANRLGLAYMGMDAQIVERAGIPIPDIVETFGWSGFRDRETQLALELAQEEGLVVDTGGGIIERPENMAALGKNAVVVWLKATVDTIVFRIQGDSQRPSLTGKKSFTEEVEEVLASRVANYRAAAHYEIDTDALTPEEVAERVIGICDSLALLHTCAPDVRLRFADASDCSLLLAFIHSLAAYERLSHEVAADEASLKESLFNGRKVAEVVLAEYKNEPAGFALFFHTYSTFLAKRGLYLEDLFVKPEFRGKGVGQELFACMARIAVDRKCGRLEWAVLNWNEPAIHFYSKHGGQPMDEWTMFRVSGDDLKELAAQKSG